jgi:ferredoxin
MVEADVLINLPKVKSHGQMVLTSAVKNSFGAVIGLEKAQWHMRSGRNPVDFAELLLHIHHAVSPALHIVDGIIGMEGNGPGSGTPRKLGLVLASTNAHALDFILCKILGIDPDSVFTLWAAKQLGILPQEGQISLMGETLEEVRLAKPWQLARPMRANIIGGLKIMAPLFERLLTLTPRIHKATCTACGECVALCAPNAMSMQHGKSPGNAEVMIDRDKCISCLCCQELCPAGAITVKTGWLAQLLGLGTR